MHQIQLDDQLYKEAQRRATEAGFATVDEYVAEMLSRDPVAENEDFDHLFTPEVIADLDNISAAIKSGGKTYTLDEVREHFEGKRKQWLEARAR
jgi:hypothetical protein